MKPKVDEFWIVEINGRFDIGKCRFDGYFDLPGLTEGYKADRAVRKIDVGALLDQPAPVTDERAFDLARRISDHLTTEEAAIAIMEYATDAIDQELKPSRVALAQHGDLITSMRRMLLGAAREAGGVLRISKATQDDTNPNEWRVDVLVALDDGAIRIEANKIDGVKQ